MKKNRWNDLRFRFAVLSALNALNQLPPDVVFEPELDGNVFHPKIKWFDKVTFESFARTNGIGIKTIRGVERWLGRRLVSTSGTRKIPPGKYDMLIQTESRNNPAITDGLLVHAKKNILWLRDHGFLERMGFVLTEV